MQNWDPQLAEVREVFEIKAEEKGCSGQVCIRLVKMKTPSSEQDSKWVRTTCLLVNSVYEKRQIWSLIVLLNKLSPSSKEECGR